MRVDPGGVYLVELQLANAENLGPTWLVGAFAAGYPGADVVSVDAYRAHMAIVRIRWRSAVAGEVTVGDTVGGMVQGVSLPGQAVPNATVTAVRHTGIRMPSIEQAIPAELKLVLSGAILVATWYFSLRIKHAKPRTAGAGSPPSNRAS